MISWALGCLFYIWDELLPSYVRVLYHKLYRIPSDFMVHVTWSSCHWWVLFPLLMWWFRSSTQLFVSCVFVTRPKREWRLDFELQVFKKHERIFLCKDVLFQKNITQGCKLQGCTSHRLFTVHWMFSNLLSITPLTVSLPLKSTWQGPFKGRKGSPAVASIFQQLFC